MNSLLSKTNLLAICAMGLVACDKASQSATGTPPAAGSLPANYQAVTTCGMVTDIVRNVVGEQGTVTGLMGEGVDPHLYKPTRDDVARLLKADVVFYSGLLLEGRMTDTFTKVATRGTPVFAVTELLEEKFLLEPEDAPGHADPHVWMDVAAWTRATEAVGEALATADRPHAASYKERAVAYQAELKKLDDYARSTLATVPKPRRVLITAHDAFNYFGRAYDLEVKGIQGISTESEAGLADVKQLVDFIVERQVQAVFVESSVSDKNIRALVEGCQNRGHTITIGGELFSDAMGAPGSYEGTYIGMIDHNVTTIVRALGGQAPEKGFQGKLTAKH